MVHETTVAQIELMQGDQPLVKIDTHFGFAGKLYPVSAGAAQTIYIHLHGHGKDDLWRKWQLRWDIISGVTSSVNAATLLLKGEF